MYDCTTKDLDWMSARDEPVNNSKIVTIKFTFSDTESLSLPFSIITFTKRKLLYLISITYLHIRT